MRIDDGHVVTPIYVKTASNMSWPDDDVFYWLTAEGLYLCRNHPFFRSSVPARNWPSELAWHNSSLVLRYPPIRRRRLAQTVAFFADVGERFSAEAIVLLGWNERRQQVEIIVPDQVATVGRNRWGDTWPVGVDYERPRDLPSELTIFGSIHSHVGGPAYHSFIDRDDETHRPGLHIVIGRVFSEPPDFSAQAVVDGTRFDVPPDKVLPKYRRRAQQFPQHWLERLQIQWLGGKLLPPPETKPAASQPSQAAVDSRPNAPTAAEQPVCPKQEAPDGDQTETATRRVTGTNSAERPDGEDHRSRGSG